MRRDPRRLLISANSNYWVENVHWLTSRGMYQRDAMG